MCVCVVFLLCSFCLLWLIVTEPGPPFFSMADIRHRVCVCIFRLERNPPPFCHLKTFFLFFFFSFSFFFSSCVLFLRGFSRSRLWPLFPPPPRAVSPSTKRKATRYRWPCGQPTAGLDFLFLFSFVFCFHSFSTRWQATHHQAKYISAHTLYIFVEQNQVVVFYI